MGALDNFGGLLSGAGALGQQYQQLANAWTGSSEWTNVGSYDFPSDTVAYVPGAKRHPVIEGDRRDDSAVAWLDRRVDEVRVKL